MGKRKKKTYRYHLGTRSFFHASSLAAPRLAAAFEAFEDVLETLAVVAARGGW